MSKNRNLHGAKRAKNDEFYTQLTDIEKELNRYDKLLFKDKTVLLNCDDDTSEFWRHFVMDFHRVRNPATKGFCGYGLKKLVATHFSDDGPSYKLEYSGEKDADGQPVVTRTPLKQNGDFRSPECVEILKQADIVVTNPPFSLFREFVRQLVEHDKKFLVIGNMNAITYKEIFPLIRDNRLWLGATGSGRDMCFAVPRGTPVSDSDKRAAARQGFVGDYTRLGNSCWFTNLPHKKRYEELPLGRKYAERGKYGTPEYPKYDNYEAINVDKVVDIPEDYDGVMGVPISFLDKHCPEQFEILGCDYCVKLGLLPALVVPGWVGKLDRGYLKGERQYSRIFIRQRSR